MTSIVIGGLGNTIATGTIRVGIETIIGVIGQGKNFIGHHQVILATEGHMESRVVLDLAGLQVSRVDQDMEDLRVSRVDLGHMVNQVAQAEVDLTPKYMDHRAK